MTKYISCKDSVTFEETVKAVELFEKLTVTDSSHDVDLVMNTDQTECKYCVNVR
jgi:hypothetical protein